MNSSSEKRFVSVLFTLIALFVAGRYFGQYLSDGAWSLTHWQFLPGWYGPLWIITLAAFGFLFQRTTLLERLSVKNWFLPALAVALGGILWALQFDSYLFGGGSHRIAQVGLADRIFLRWFEFGSILLAKLGFGLFSTLHLEPLSAAVASWKVSGFIGAILSAVASWMIARNLSNEKIQRLFLFLIVFFGPQAILHFGYVGMEPLIAATTMWFLYGCVRLSMHWSGRNILIVWGILAIGVFFHISTLYLFPAAVFVTLSGSPKGLGRLGPGLIGAALALAALVFVVYWQAGQSLEFSRWILFAAGKQPHSDYGLFSLPHLADFLQTIVLAAPVIVLTFGLRILEKFEPKARLMVFTICLAQISGLVAMFVQDPINSAPLDFPRLALFLTPSAVLLAAVISGSENAEIFRRRLVPLTAAFVLLLPFATLPVYTRIDQAATYMTSYLDKREIWCREVGLTFRDAFFGRKGLGSAELDKANTWEQMIPARSVDYLNFRGSVYLSQSHDTEEALRQLYYLIVKNPYWTEPREAVASIMIGQSRWDRAKPQIDTCLLLEPYNLEHHRTLYSYYRNQQNMPMAMQTIEQARELFPKDKEVATDYMIFLYNTGKNAEAVKVAEGLIARDKGLPFPYLIRGFVADHAGNLSSALDDYRAFLAKQKDQPETLMVKQRIDQITNAGIVK